MHLPKLTPLQSRSATSFGASLVLLVIYLSFSTAHLAYAADSDSIERGDHNHPLIPDADHVLELDREEATLTYDPEFVGVSRDIIGRADSTPTPLANNVPGKSSINEGEVQYWMFPSSLLSSPPTAATPIIQQDSKRDLEEAKEVGSHELKRRQGTNRQLFVTLNTCVQPSSGGGNPTGPPGQLQIFISQDQNNKQPGPGVNDPSQQVVPVDGGFSNHSILASDSVWFGVSAPQNSGFSGNYNYELTASTDAPYTSYEDRQSLFFVDSDAANGLFVTTNLTTTNDSSDPEFNAWITTPPLFSIYVHNKNDSLLAGLQRSYCGLNNHAQVKGNINGTASPGVVADMTTVSVSGGHPLQRFYVQNLNASSSYFAMMALTSNNTKSGPGNVGGGGTVWQSIEFATKNGMLNFIGYLDPS